MVPNRGAPSEVEVSAKLPDLHDASVQVVSHFKKRGGFYQRCGKRLFDLLVSAGGLILLSPILVVIAVLVKSSSRGPVLFQQHRVGKDGRLFDILKFRSMVDGAERERKNITSNSDARITPLGAFLRKWKLDELPQLWNVLIGEMSLVGPRPEVPSYVVGYTIQQKDVLMVRPGITDAASLRYRDEGGLLERSRDPELLYRERILPEKLSLNLQYLEDISLVRDLSLILKTLMSVVKFSKN